MKRQHIDNHRVRVVHAGLEAMKLAVELALNGDEATGFRIDEDSVIVYRYDRSSGQAQAAGYQNFLAPIGHEELSSILWGWIRSDESARPPESDHDGSNIEGFCIEMDEWGRIGSDNGAAFRVTFEWGLVGK